MKQYEYKYVKTEATLKNLKNFDAFDEDAALLTGLGLEGWQVKQMIQAGTILNTYYLLEREVVRT